MIRPREWDYNKSGALKRRTSLGAEKRGIMTTGRYNSSEGSHIGTAITFLLIGLGAGALAGQAGHGATGSGATAGTIIAHLVVGRRTVS